MAEARSACDNAQRPGGMADKQGSQHNNQNALTHREVWRWLIVHGVPIRQIDGKSARFFFDHISGNALGPELKSELNHQSSHSLLSQFPDLNSS